MLFNPDLVVAAVRRWVESVVVDLNLCPFAKKELLANRVRFAVTASTSQEQLLTALHKELTLLDETPSIETTLLIHPGVLANFNDYNQFLDYADHLLVQMQREGIYQIASFHPDYQFAGTSATDAENYSNRAPYPLLHLIREQSLENAIAAYPNAGQIPERNIQLMNSLGRPHLQALLEACSETVD